MKNVCKILVSMTAVSVMLASGCSVSGNRGEAASEASSQEDVNVATVEKDTGGNGGEIIEVEIWEYFEDLEHEYFTEMMNQWGEENGYRFKIVQYPYSDLNKQYTLGMVSGELPDLTMINNCDTASYVEMGMLQDITASVDAWGEAGNFYEAALNTTTIDGKYYGLPYNSNCLVLYYDEDMLKEAGIEVPKTWEDLTEAALALTKDTTYGFAMSLVNNDEGTFQYFPFLYSSGADMYKMGSPEAISSVQLLKDMMDAGSMSSEVINWSQADVCQQFIQGNAAMMINGPWQIPLLKESVPDKKWNCAPIPMDQVLASALGGEGFSVVKGADLEKIWPVMEFMMSRETLAEWNHTVGKIPSRKDSLDIYPDWKDDPIMNVFFEQLNYAAVLGPDVSWPEISAAIYTGLQEAMTGQKTVEEACQGAQEKIDKLVEE